MRLRLGLLGQVLLALIAIISMATCAKQGSPSGGPIDSLPPVFVRADPPNFTTNFEADRIRIYFDEFVTLEDQRKQVVISPPLTNSIIGPQGNITKYISIDIKDTLQPNTTYVFNFGQSIVDNNEGNPYPFFKYIFSTGDYIDSLTVKGSVKDAFLEETEEYIAVVLHEVDTTYTDSIVFKEVPRYVATTLDSITDFELTNLKEGTYAIFAIKDDNSDYKYQPSLDKLAFLDRYITVPSDDTYDLKLFKENPPTKAGRPRHVAEQRINFGYTGNGDSLSIGLLSNVTIDTLITRKEGIDTLNYWFKPKIEEKDSLNFEAYTIDYRDTLTVKLRQLVADSLTLTSKTGAVLVLNKPYQIASSIPITGINNELITVLNKDSIPIPFTSELDTRKSEVSLTFETEEEGQYYIQLLPEALTDFLGNKSDTLNYRPRTRQFLNYSDIELTLVNAKAFPYIVQLLNDNGNLIEERYAIKEKVFTFNTLRPGMYTFRLIEDTNKNGIFDTGNYLEKRQPERVIYFGKLIDAREGWFPKETFTLKDRPSIDD